MKNAAEVLTHLNLRTAESRPFHLRVGSVGVSVLCPDPLRSKLTAYFAEAMSDAPGDFTVHLLPGQTLAPELAWTDWQREPGKPGRKDAILDLTDARLIRKVRSGVTFLQAPDMGVALGPLEQNESTVINFINMQILNTYLRDGWQLCHSAAVTRADRTLAISGLSGGGKSTTILRMMDLEGTSFLSNDRLLIRAGQPPDVRGIPKHPRINPGTILGNPRLHGMLPPARRAELAAMDTAELWALEDKHDLVIGDVYGSGRVRFEGHLNALWVLNWSHSSTVPTRVSEVTLADRPDLLGAIMKSPGPFYQHPDGSFEPNGNKTDPRPYLEALENVSVCEVSGRINFDALVEHGRNVLYG